MPEDTRNWRDGLRPQVVDEIDGIIRAFRGSSDRRPEVKAARNDHGVDHPHAEGQTWSVLIILSACWNCCRRARPSAIS